MEAKAQQETCFDVHEVLHDLILENVALVLAYIRWQWRRCFAFVEIDLRAPHTAGAPGHE